MERQYHGSYINIVAPQAFLTICVCLCSENCDCDQGLCLTEASRGKSVFSPHCCGADGHMDVYRVSQLSQALQSSTGYTIAVPSMCHGPVALGRAASRTYDRAVLCVPSLTILQAFYNHDAFVAVSQVHRHNRTHNTRRWQVAELQEDAGLGGKGAIDQQFYQDGAWY